jgi:hypothetical protein
LPRTQWIGSRASRGAPRTRSGTSPSALRKPPPTCGSRPSGADQRFGSPGGCDHRATESAEIPAGCRFPVDTVSRNSPRRQITATAAHRWLSCISRAGRRWHWVQAAMSNWTS